MEPRSPGHDLDRELLDHVERRVADLVKDASRTNRHRRAHIELGGVTQVQEGVAGTWTSLARCTRGRRYAMRGLAGNGLRSARVAVRSPLAPSIVNTVLLQ